MSRWVYFAWITLASLALAWLWLDNRHLLERTDALTKQNQARIVDQGRALDRLDTVLQSLGQVVDVQFNSCEASHKFVIASRKRVNALLVEARRRKQRVEVLNRSAQLQALNNIDCSRKQLAELRKAQKRIATERAASANEREGRASPKIMYRTVIRWRTRIVRRRVFVDKPVPHVVIRRVRVKVPVIVRVPVPGPARTTTRTETRTEVRTTVRTTPGRTTTVTTAGGVTTVTTPGSTVTAPADTVPAGTTTVTHTISNPGITTTVSTTPEPKKCPPRNPHC